MSDVDAVRRRLLLGAVLGLAAPGVLRAQTPPAAGGLRFEVWRKGQRIGRHTLDFRRQDAALVVAIAAEMVVKLGPVPVFHYRHEATETWRGGRFASLESRTISNGKHERVSAVRTPAGVTLDTGAGAPRTAPAETLPLTHWNQAALRGPLFNPQTGVVLRESASRQTGQTATLADGRTVAATRWTLAGDAEIVDWYDDADAWAALRGRAPDGSYIEYRRSA